VRNAIAALVGIVSVVVVGFAASAQSRTSADPIARAAEALGGRDRILSIRTLTVEGYGQAAQQNGGGNVTSSPDAPQKWQNFNDYVRVIDLANGRMRIRQRQYGDFVFATLRNMRGALTRQGLDGNVA